MSLKDQFEVIAPQSLQADLDTPEGKLAVLQDIEMLFRLLVEGLDSTYFETEFLEKIGVQRASVRRGRVGLHNGVSRHPVALRAISRRIEKVIRAQVRTGGIVAKTYFVDVVGEDEVIQDIYLVSDVATAGSNATDNYEFMPKRNGVNLLSAPKSTDGAEIAASIKYTMGTLLSTQTTASAGDVITLEVTKNGTPTDLSGAETMFGLEANSDFGS